MKKIKTIFLGLIAALGLAGCGGIGSETAFVEQRVEAEVKESAVVVALPKKTEEQISDVKGYLQVKIRDVGVYITPYSLDEETGKEVAGTALEGIILHLEDDERFINAAYEKAFELLNLENGDGEKLNYKILDKEIGTPYHKGIALKFKINLEELSKINSYDVLKEASHFTLKVKDITTSAYSILRESRPFAELPILWDGEAFILKEEIPAEDPGEGGEEDPSEPGEGEGEPSNPGEGEGGEGEGAGE